MYYYSVLIINLYTDIIVLSSVDMLGSDLMSAGGFLVKSVTVCDTGSLYFDVLLPLLFCISRQIFTTFLPVSSRTHPFLSVVDSLHKHFCRL